MYKRISEYSDVELSNLTMEEMNNVIDLESAHAGVPLLPTNPGSAPTKPAIRTVPYYEVGNIKVLKQADAMAILAAIEKCELYQVEGWDESRRLSKMERGSYYWPKIETAEAPSKEIYEKHKDEIDQYKKQHDEWAGANNLYNEAVKARKNIKDMVTETIDSASSRVRRIERLKSIFTKYLEMAGGDRFVAEKFLVDAEKPTEEEMKIIGLFAPVNRPTVCIDDEDTHGE